MSRERAEEAGYYHITTHIDVGETRTTALSSLHSPLKTEIEVDDDLGSARGSDNSEQGVAVYRPFWGE